MDQPDGALPVSVEYQTFQQMYSTLQSGIQAGLSDVVNEAFSRTLIPPRVKSVACNLSTGEPARAEVFLDSLLARTKTYQKTFDELADLLQDVPSFDYLAEDMRRQRDKLAEERMKKMKDMQVEKAIQEKRRQDLGLQFSADPVETPLSSGPLRVTHPEAHSSPSMYAAVRRVDHHFTTPPPSMAADLRNPEKFNPPMQIGVTSPELEPNSLLSSIGVAALKGSLPYVHSTTGPVAVLSVAKNPEPPQPAVTAAKSLESSPSQVTSSTSVVPNTSARQPGTNHSLDTHASGPGCELETAVSSTSDQSSIECPKESEKAVDSCEVSSTQPLPSRCVTAPTPGSSLPPSVPSASSSDDNEHSVVVALRPRSNSCSNHRSISVESSISDCSHDFSTPLSSLESEIEASQESEDTHCSESPVHNAPRVKRSISCEKCCKKKWREFEKIIAEQQLEITQLNAAYNSQSQKLISDQQGLESKLYELHVSIKHHEMANMELQRRNEELLRANQALRAENLKADDEIRRVKADAWDENRELRKALAEKERAKHAEPQYIQCNYCRVTFPLHT